jgi:ubiquinone/menaquinone biosynthesis C-methylase UbiE
VLQRLFNLDPHYRRPSGWLGRYVGRSMARDHQPENQWTVAMLAVQPNDHILELGFGPGIAIQALTKLAPHGRISGIDFSKTMVHAAGRRNRAAVRRGQVALHYGDVARLPFADRSFDKAFGIHTIYFWPQPLAALREIRRVLKPGGALTITVLPKERWNELDPDLPVGTPECRPYSGAELLSMLAEAGFVQTRIAQGDPQQRSNFCAIGVRPTETT